MRATSSTPGMVIDMGLWSWKYTGSSTLQWKQQQLRQRQQSGHDGSAEFAGAEDGLLEESGALIHLMQVRSCCCLLQSMSVCGGCAGCMLVRGTRAAWCHCCPGLPERPLGGAGGAGLRRPPRAPPTAAAWCRTGAAQIAPTRLAARVLIFKWPLTAGRQWAQMSPGFFDAPGAPGASVARVRLHARVHAGMYMRSSLCLCPSAPVWPPRTEAPCGVVPTLQARLRSCSRACTWPQTCGV